MIARLPVLSTQGFRTRFSTELRSAPTITTLQINIGYVCNLACRHCHVESSPARTGPSENMTRETAERIVAWTLNQDSIRTVDITGGSPEMNPNFRWMVETFHRSGRQVLDRCNPTIIASVDRDSGERFDWIPEFLAAHEVQVIASLPCYLEDNVDHQRGRGAYGDSIDGLRKLNQAGYGIDSRLQLNLVYNPNGPHLPPAEASLEADYKRELRSRFGLEFNRLWAITNMPIRRWRHDLERQGKLEAYMALLVNAFNAATIDGLMCRHQISVDPEGRLYDCDFNQALELATPGLSHRRLWEVSVDELEDRMISTEDHCYGCTAGAGSSCGGEIV